MTDNRRLLTWTLNAGNTAYQQDLEKYTHKIYAIGIHEFTVKGDGRILDRRSGNNFTVTKFPISIENDMIKHRHIKWYLSMTLFGTTDLFAMFDNTANQDAFITNLQGVVDQYRLSRNTGTPLNHFGIEIDFEATLSGHDARSGDDVKYINILKRIKNEVCIPNGLKLQVNAFAMWGANNPYYYRFHNYKQFAEATDQTGKACIDTLQIMSYDFSWAGSAPGASTPVWWFNQVCDWASQNFDPKKNPNAKLTIDKLFFGCAGYGNRWGIFDPNNLTGRNITYRNLLDWQNGLFRHNHKETGANGDYWVWHNQEFICQNAFEDPVSKNQVMFQHVYDYWQARYGNVKRVNEIPTCQRSVYNGKEFLTTYSRLQQGSFTGVSQVVTDIERKYGSSEYADTAKGVDVGGSVYNFRGYKCEAQKYSPRHVYDPETGDLLYAYCSWEIDPDTGEYVEPGVLEYKLSPGVGGNYRVVALTGFPWYTQSKLSGTLNGQSFTIGGDNLPDYYPYYFKHYHWWDMGNFNLTAIDNTITIHGNQGHYGTRIYGFVVCSGFSPNHKGGEVTFPVNVQPFKTKEGTDAPVPQNLVVTSEILRQEARPVILWEDNFASFLKDVVVQYHGLTDGRSFYYKRYGTYKNWYYGSWYDDYEDLCYAEFTDGLSYGMWRVKEDEQKVAFSEFDYTNNKGKDSRGNTIDFGTSGQLMFNHVFKGNLMIEAEVNLLEGDAVGIRFGCDVPGDGYIFKVDYKNQKVSLIHENPYPNVTTICEQPLSSALERGKKMLLKVIIHNGNGYFYAGYGYKQYFLGEGVYNPTGAVDTSTGTVTLARQTGGGCGVWASDTITRVCRLSISTTDRWETMEKFEIEVDGQVYNYGQIARPGYSYDQYGYLIYSGLDERVTRSDQSELPKDYKFTVVQIPGFTGTKDVTVRLLDPGLWFANLYVGDAEGCSITYAGDAFSFNQLMNIVVNDYGAKGLGLWTMGQEDPQVFELVPDVIPPPPKN